MSEFTKPSGNTTPREAAPKTWKEGMQRQRDSVRRQSETASTPSAPTRPQGNADEAKLPPSPANPEAAQEAPVFQVTARTDIGVPWRAAQGGDDLMSEEQE